MNQEDSITCNQSSIDCGAFNASFYNYEKAELDKGEQFGNPDYARTMDIKKDAIYEYVQNGFIAENTLAKKGYVLIVKAAKIPKPVDQYLYIDKSIVYKREEPVYIERVITTRNDEDQLIAKVKLRADRPMTIGDKFCYTPDHDVLTRRGWVPIADVTLDDEVACLEGEAFTYSKPTELFVYDHSGDMYLLQSQLVDLCVTPNHHMYVRHPHKNDYEFLMAQDIMGKKLHYKKNGNWMHEDVESFTARYIHEGITGGQTWPDLVFRMDDWLEFLGIWISDGNLVKANHCQIQITCTKERKIENLNRIMTNMGFEIKSFGKNHYIYSSQIYASLKDLNVGAPNKRLPEYVWDVSQRQARLLLAALIAGDGHESNGNITFNTSSKLLAEDLSRLALHAGYSGYVYIDKHAGYQCKIVENGKERTITAKHNSYKISICRSKNTPLVNSGKNKHDSLVHYDGKVYCLTVNSHIIYVKRNNKPVWCSQSSRTGNKGICAHMMPRCDMPYCEDGLVPDLIVNAHSIPTRMAVNQIIECVLGQLGVRKGCFIDATSFRKHDIDAVLAELETFGVKYGGHRRMYNGKTGDWIDTLIFIGPTTYQRLQKFVIDEHYATRTGPTSALTRQPLDGKNNDGGLRLGEMEKDVFCAHGTMRALWEKYYKDSDGIDLPICRLCGNRAVVNEKMGIYKCKYCGDNADIVNVASSWVANLFFSEASAMNVKMSFELDPFTYSKMEGQ